MARKKEKEPLFLKVIYFDESTAQDYIDIVNGGRLDWSKEENKEKIAKILAEIEAEAQAGFNVISFIKAMMSSGFGGKGNETGEKSGDCRTGI